MNMLSVLKNTAFFKSFKRLDGPFLFSVVLDFIYYVLFLLGGSFFLFRVYPRIFQLRDALNEVDNVAALESMGSLLTDFQMYTLLVFVFLILNYVFFKWLIWKVLLKEKVLGVKGSVWSRVKPALLQLSTFFVVVLLLGALLVLVSVVSYFLFKEKAFGYLFFLVYLPFFSYLILFTHLLAVHTRSIKKTGELFVRLVIGKLHRLAFPFILMMFLGFVWIGFIQKLLFLPANAYVVLYTVLISAFFTWCKVYALELVEKVEGKKVRAVNETKGTGVRKVKSIGKEKKV